MRQHRMRPLGRAVVPVIVAVIGLILFSAASAAAFIAGYDDMPTPVDLNFGPFTAGVDWWLPPTALIVAALTGMAAIAAGALLLDSLASSRLRSSHDRATLEQQYQHVRVQATAGNPVRITVLVPAHNEEAGIAATLASLRAQQRTPDRVIVVADNCTDATETIAAAAGVDVWPTVGNTDRKAGALNQALTRLLPEMTAADAVLVMDADTVLSPQFLAAAADYLECDPTLDAIGGVFTGAPDRTWIGQLQRNEYARYQRQIARRRGRVFVLTGTATLFRADALSLVADARGKVLPGGHGQVYDTAALTEDNELTLALKSLGCDMYSPDECTVVTEVMTTWGDLRRQRLRWQRGALENLSWYGLTSATARYWAQQAGIAYGIVALNSSWLFLTLAVISAGHWTWFPFWLATGAVFLTERVVTAWHTGWRGRLLAALLLPEVAYDIFLQSVYLRGMIEITTGRRAHWGHVPAPGQEQP